MTTLIVPFCGVRAGQGICPMRTALMVRKDKLDPAHVPHLQREHEGVQQKWFGCLEVCSEVLWAEWD